MREPKTFRWVRRGVFFPVYFAIDTSGEVLGYVTRDGWTFTAKCGAYSSEFVTLTDAKCAMSTHLRNTRGLLPEAK